MSRARRSMVMALVAGLLSLVSPTSASAADGPFSDVHSDSPFVTEITWMVDRGLTTGYPDGTFRPTNAVTRQAFAAYLYRHTTGRPGGACADATAGDRFSDVGADHPFCEAIMWLADSGVTTGYADGTFRPSAVITRQAIAAFLYRLQHGGADAGSCVVDGAEAPDGGAAGTPPFPDVAIDNPFCRAITWLTATGPTAITTGYSDGTFRPSGNTSRQATAAYLYRYHAAFPPDRADAVKDLAAHVVDYPAQSIALVEDDATTAGRILTLESGAAAPAVGQSLVVQPSAEIPGGTSGRVTSVTEGPGGVVVALEPVPLNTLFDTLAVGYTGEVELVVEDTEATMSSFGVAPTSKISFAKSAFTCTSGTSADVSASLDFDNTSVDFVLEVGSLIEKPYASFALSTEPVISVTGSASGATSCKLSDAWRNRFRVKWVIPTGPVPMVITVKPYVEFEMSAEGAVNVSQRFIRFLGVETDSLMRPVVKSTGKALDPVLSVTGQVSGSAGLGADLAVRAYDAAGLSVTVGPRLDAVARAVTSTEGTAAICFDLSAVVESEFELQLNLWFDKWEYELLATSAGPWQLGDQCMSLRGGPTFGTPVPLDVVVPEATARFTFAAKAGDDLGIALAESTLPATSGLHYLRLLGPTGSTVKSAFASSANATLTMTARDLPATGTYTVVLDPHGETVGGGTLYVSTELALSGRTDGPYADIQLDRPGQTAGFSFAAAAGQTLGIAFSSSTLPASVSPLTYLRLLGPAGTIVDHDYTSVAGSTLSFTSRDLPTTGTYTLVLDPAGDATGRGKLHVSEEIALTGTVDGDPTAVTLTRPGQTASLSFPGTAGQDIGAAFSASTLPATVNALNYLRLLDPTGAVVAQDYTGAADSPLSFTSRDLPTTGTYTLVLDPADDATGSGTLQASQEIALSGTLDGRPESVTLSRPGQTASLSFPGTAGQVIGAAFSTSTLPVSVNALNYLLLLDPTGTPIESVYTSTAGTTLSFTLRGLPTTGTYTLLLDPGDDATGSGTLQVSQEMALSGTVDGEPVPVTLTRAGQTAGLSFPGTAGQVVNAAFSSSTLPAASSGLHYLRLLDPAGAVMESAYTSSADTTLSFTSRGLPADGTYTLVLDPAGDATGSGQLQVSQEVSVTTTIDGGPLDLRTSRPGQTAAMSFFAGTGQDVVIALDGSDLPAGLHRLVLLDPDGVQVVSQSRSGSEPFSLSALDLAKTGYYRAVLDPADDAVGGGSAQVTSAA